MPEPSTALKLDCTVSLNRPLAAGVQLMRLHCPELAESIEPGQFFDLHVPGDPTHMLRLPFSYSHADPESGEVEFAFRIRGEGTERLAGLPEGTATDLLGPAGKGWTVPEGVRKALLVAGGRGIVTLISLAEELSRRLVPFHLVQGASIAAGIVFTERAEELAGSAAAVRPVTEDGSVGDARAGERGRLRAHRGWGLRRRLRLRARRHDGGGRGRLQGGRRALPGVDGAPHVLRVRRVHHVPRRHGRGTQGRVQGRPGLRC